MRIIKLPIGLMNIPYVKCKVGYAEGSKKPRRVKRVLCEEVFNPPVLSIQLRKGA